MSAFTIVPFDDPTHRKEVVELWRNVFGYETAHNEPNLAIDRKLEAGDGLFFVAIRGGTVVGSVMAGYDGHRGWLYSLAVLPAHRHRGIGSALVRVAEKALAGRGCMKINLQIVEGNEAVQAFYSALGYAAEVRVSMGKPILENIRKTTGADGRQPGRETIPHDTTILSDRLRLRHFSKSDIPFVFSASRHRGFCDGMRWNPPQSEDELLEPFLANEQAWQSGAAYAFTIESRTTTEPLGRIVIRRQEDSVWDLGFWTHPLHQGQGYMTEAAVALIDFGFTRLGASEIQASHATWNVASRRVLEKAGLHFIRRIPEGFQKNGEWVEEDLLSITRRQWQQKTADGS